MATILIAEDRAVDRQFLVTLLAITGMACLEAVDGREALALVQRRRPHLAISDVLMPTMDGYEFVRQMHAMAEVAATPVIFYTATYHEREARALAESCGEGRANSVDDLAVQGVAAGRRVLAKCGPNLPTFRDLWESVLQMDIVRVGPRCRRAFRSRAAI